MAAHQPQISKAGSQYRPLSHREHDGSCLLGAGRHGSWSCLAKNRSQGGDTAPGMCWPEWNILASPLFSTPSVSGPYLHCLNRAGVGTSLVVQWLRLHAATPGDMGLVPDRGTKILQASRSLWPQNLGKVVCRVCPLPSRAVEEKGWGTDLRANRKTEVDYFPNRPMLFCSVTWPLPIMGGA